MDRLKNSLIAFLCLAALVGAITLLTPLPAPGQQVGGNAGQPFQTSVSVPAIAAGSLSNLASFVVPDGKRLVIEFISISGGVPSGQRLFARVSTRVGGEVVSFPIVLSNAGPSGVQEIFRASQLVRLYADPGSNVVCLPARNNTTDNTSGITFSFSGYLVDVAEAAP